MSASPTSKSGWAEIEAALDGMLARRWYTNHGPMAQVWERHLAQVHGVHHAVIATNPSIALVMLMDGFGLAGGVLLSALAPRYCLQAVRWAGLRPVICDADPVVGGLTVRAVAHCPDDVSAVLLSGTDDEAGIAVAAARRGMAVLRDGAGGREGPRVLRLDGYGEAAGLACILLEDDPLAARLRNIRSSYGAGPAVPVVRTANGRVSEAQAALALVELDRNAMTAGRRGGG